MASQCNKVQDGVNTVVLISRDRISRALTRDVRRLINEIRVGIAPDESRAHVTDLIADLDQSAFLALRPYWTELLTAVAMIADGNGRTIAIETATAAQPRPRRSRSRWRTIRTGRVGSARRTPS